ncbi:MAG TPA: TonB-dependent receptor, partial [Syntrophorhabdaceae bacterium]|nr:TonB-dependent receptor [Syntrophorhabdaceae bacterium]
NKDYSVYDTSFGARSLYDDWTIGGSIEAGTTLLPRNNIKTAFHYKRDTHNERNTVGSDNLPEPWQRSDDLISSWGMEDTIDITKSLYSIIGVSHDKAEGLRAREWDPKNVPGGWFDYAVGSTSSWNPQAGLFYLVSDTGKLHASVEKKTRFPSMKEKFSGGFGTKLPNPSLAPEKSVNYEIGYEDMFLKKVRFKTAVFHNDITNAIQSITVAPKITQNQNIGEVQQYGIEIEGVVSVTKDIEGGLNYTYLDRNNETPINQYSPTYIRLTSVPVHKIFSYVKYTTPLKGLSTLVSVEYLSDTGTTSDGIYNTGAFALVNMKASYIIREGLMVEAGVNNAFDRYYEYAVGYPEPGRTYFAGVRYSF